MKPFLATPTKAQYDWQDMEMGMFFHWFPLDEPTLYASDLTDPEVRKDVLSRMDFSGFDAKQWVQSAVDLGAKYIIFVAKHGHGFCRWRSEFGDFSITQTNYPGDPVKELHDECERRGLRMGVYICGDDKPHEARQFGRTKDPEKQDEYNKVYRGWITELLTKYGEMCEIWFDGSLEIEIGDLLRRYAPNIMVFNSRWATLRWVGQEQGYASDPAWNTVNRLDALSGISTQLNGDPDQDAWLPIECDARLRRSWALMFDKEGNLDLEGNTLKDLDQLLKIYYHTVGHGAVLLLNHAPLTNGRILDEDMARMKELGDEIRRRFGSCIARTSGEGDEVILDLDEPQKVDHVILMEEIRYGERIRVYRVDGLVDGEWVKLSSGTAVGHKKIDFFEPQVVSKLRFVALKAVDTPIIRDFQAIYVGETPKFGDAPQYGESKIGEWGTEKYEWNMNMYDFTWVKAHFSYPLDAFITDAGQYQVTFRHNPDFYSSRKEVDPLVLTRVWLEMDGVEYPEYVTPVEGEENTFKVYINGLAPNMVFHAESLTDNPKRFWPPDHAGAAFIKRMI